MKGFVKVRSVGGYNAQSQYFDKFSPVYLDRTESLKILGINDPTMLFPKSDFVGENGAIYNLIITGAFFSGKRNAKKALMGSANVSEVSLEKDYSYTLFDVNGILTEYIRSGKTTLSRKADNKILTKIAICPRGMSSEVVFRFHAAIEKGRVIDLYKEEVLDIDEKKKMHPKSIPFRHKYTNAPRMTNLYTTWNLRGTTVETLKKEGFSET